MNASSLSNPPLHNLEILRFEIKDSRFAIWTELLSRMSFENYFGKFATLGCLDKRLLTNLFSVSIRKVMSILILNFEDTLSTACYLFGI